MFIILAWQGRMRPVVIGPFDNEDQAKQARSDLISVTDSQAYDIEVVRTIAEFLGTEQDDE